MCFKWYDYDDGIN